MNIQLSANLLREAVTSPLKWLSSQDLLAESFHDKDLQAKFQAMRRKIHPTGGQEPAIKRRRVCQESNATPDIKERLYEILEVPSTGSNALGNIEAILL